MEIVQDLTEHLINSWGLIAVFVLMISNGFFSFPPSELVISFAGALVAASDASFILALTTAVAGHFIGTAIWFVLGWYTGAALIQRIKDVKFVKLHPKLDRFVPTAKMLDAICSKFRISGAKWTFVFRFLPFVRSAISIPAGIARIPVYKFIVYTIAGDIIWSMLWLLLGYYLGKEFSEGRTTVTTILTALLLLLMLWIGYRVRKWLLSAYANDDDESK